MLSFLVQYAGTNAAFRLAEGPTCAEGNWVAMPGSCVGALGHTDYQAQGTPKSFHRDTVKTVDLLPFHSSTSKMPHIKPVYLGWFLADILLVVFCSASPQCGRQ